MYSQLQLTFAKLINESYYDKLITNIAKEKYNNPNFNIKPNELDIKFIVDIDKKIALFMYNDLINNKLSLVKENGYSPYLDINERIEYIYNKTNAKKDNYINIKIVEELIKNENYDILYDILTKTQNNYLKEKIEYKIYPNTEIIEDLYSRYDEMKICFNKENEKLLYVLANSGKNGFVGQDKLIEKQYIIKLLNEIKDVFYYNTNQMDFYYSSDDDKENKLKEIGLSIINYNLVFINEYINLDLNPRDYLKEIIFELSKENDANIFITIFLDHLEIDKYKQFELLKETFDKNHSIFKLLIKDNDSYETKHYLTYSDSKIELEKEKVNTISELLESIKKEQIYDNQIIMFNKFKEYFKLDLSINDLNNMFITTEAHIKDLSKDEFNELYFKESNERLNEFNNKFNELN